MAVAPAAPAAPHPAPQIQTDTKGTLPNLDRAAGKNQEEVQNNVEYIGTCVQAQGGFGFPAHRSTAEKNRQGRLERNAQGIEKRYLCASPKIIESAPSHLGTQGAGIRVTSIRVTSIITVPDINEPNRAYRVILRASCSCRAPRLLAI